MPSVRVLSFVFDGCLFHRDYRRASLAILSSLPAVIEKNQSLLEAIKIENSLYREVTSFIGSARQSEWIDKANSQKNGTESCFIAILSVCRYLGIKFNPLLLTDVYQGLDAGTSYRRAMGAEGGEHLHFPGDETKFTLLYAQMHAVALNYPKDTITFDFYDDRDHDKEHARGILSFLSRVFMDYPQLIPSNVLLRLNHYAGVSPSVFSVIDGQGECQRNYASKINILYHHVAPRGKMIRFDNLLAHLHLILPPPSRKDVTSPEKFPECNAQSTVTWGIFSPLLTQKMCLSRPDSPPFPSQFLRT